MLLGQGSGSFTPTRRMTGRDESLGLVVDSRCEHFAENEDDGPPDLLAPILLSTVYTQSRYTPE